MTDSTTHRISLPEFAPARELESALDWTFFVVAGLGAAWYAWLLVRVSFSFGWWQIAFAAGFWVLLAYLLLPRLHRILTTIYVPNYFIGRARTSDGLLGDPVNLALLGDERQVHRAMAAAGWILADDVTMRSSIRIVTSTLLRRSYDEAPVSPLLLFGRKQDFAYQQEVDGSPGKRHHVRFWRCPKDWMLPGGIPVDWVAAGTYDRRVGLSLFTLQITHKIDADVDVERDHIVATVRGADPGVGVEIIRDFSTGYHSRNGGGDSIVTDGDLPVLDLHRLAAAPGDLGEVPTDSRDKRPSATIVGALLMSIGALNGLITAAQLIIGWARVASGTGVTPEDSLIVELSTVGVVLMVAIVEGLFSWFVFLGSNWARVLTLAFTTVTLVLAAVSIESGALDPSTPGTLASIAIDILMLIALSSERATVYARRPRKAPKRVTPSRIPVAVGSGRR